MLLRMEISDLYAKLIVRYAHLILLSIFCISLAAIATVISFVQMPDFSNPNKGFQSRGTEINGRSVAIKQLTDSLKSGELSFVPFCFNTNASHCENSTHDASLLPIIPMTGTEACLNPKGPLNVARRLRGPDQCSRDIDLFNDISILIVQPKREVPLFSLEGIKALCDLEEKLNLLTGIDKRSYGFCPPMSINYVIEQLQGSSPCNNVTLRINDTVKMLESCAPLYHSGLLTACYLGDKRACILAGPCALKNAVFLIMHYLSDKNFLGMKHLSNIHLSMTSIILRYNSNITDTRVLNIYQKAFEGKTIQNDKLRISGIGMGIECQLYLKHVIQTLRLFAFAGGIIALIMLINLQSITLVCSTVFIVLASFFIDWLVYALVFRFDHFPIINLIGGLLLIAIGADDVFVYTDIWKSIKREYPDMALEKRVRIVCRHAASSIFVTSFTTSAAFFANAISTITNLRLFGVFAGLGILVNFILMITWIPALLVVNEGLWSIGSCLSSVRGICYLDIVERSRIKKLWQKVSVLKKKFKSLLFDQILPTAISKFWFLWILIFVCFGVFGIISVAVYPGLQLPSTGSFLLYTRSHPFEIYRQKEKSLFRYADDSRWYLPVSFVWGIKAIDDNNYFSPDSYKPMQFYPDFNFYSPVSQLFFQRFCMDLVHSTSLLNQRYSSNMHCLFPVLRERWIRECNSSSDCCQLKFPFFPRRFQRCLPQEINRILNDSIRLVDFPVFNRDNHAVGYIASFISTMAFSFSFAKMQQFYGNLSNFLEMEKLTFDLGSAAKETSISSPEKLQLMTGWFSSQFGFYDLQLGLARGTFTALAAGLGFSFIVLLITSLNVIISVYSMVTIAFSIFTTVGILVWLGWDLNAVESVAFILAIGLSIDFCLHYGMAYRLAGGRGRSARVKKALNRVGSAVLMAALTTFITGLCIVRTTLYTYYQMATFLMIVMAVSWSFSTFFFLSVCHAVGPEGRAGDISYPMVLCRRLFNAFRWDPALNSPRLRSAQKGIIARQSLNVFDAQYIPHPLRKRLSKLSGMKFNREISEKNHDPKQIDDADEDPKEPQHSRGKNIFYITVNVNVPPDTADNSVDIAQSVVYSNDAFVGDTLNSTDKTDE